MKNQEDSQRPTEVELEERIFYTMRLLRSHLHKHQIKAAIRKFVDQQSGGYYARRGKELSGRTIETYISRALAMMKDQVAADTSAETSLSISWYQSVIADPNNRMKDKLWARKRLDEIHGIGVVNKFEHTVAATATISDGARLALETVYGKAVQEKEAEK